MSAADQLPVHSPLGASGAERWMKCPGSVALSHGAKDDDDDTYSKPGTAAHALAAGLLEREGDAWEMVGAQVLMREGEGTRIFPPYAEKPISDAVVVDKEMADAVQVYLDHVRTTFPDRNQGNTWIERRFHCPTIHPYFFGTSDFTHLRSEARALHVIDYKHGAGIIVEPKENPQLMYYAAGMLETLGLWGEIESVVLTIVQPRGFHYDGPIRSWSISIDDLVTWLEEKLVPAMEFALVSRNTASGEHCRFCPARFRDCPQLRADMQEMEGLMQKFDEKGEATPLTNAELGRFLDLFEIAKIRQKAALKTGYGRLQSDSKSIPGWKLVPSRTNREFKETVDVKVGKKVQAVKVEDLLVERYGEEAFAPKKLKSPAEIDKMPEGTKFTAEYAFKPDGGLTMAKGEDPRPAVGRDVKSMFQPVKKGK